jgi:hypothetical protein
MRFPLLITTVGLTVLSACAIAPNTGLTTVDYLFSRRDCEGARRVAEPYAKRGEPWAQFRMGAYLIDEKCPDLSPKNVPVAIEWLANAACYKSDSAWTRGEMLATGPSGYFNARLSSTRAALMLGDIFAFLNKPGLSWYYVGRARDQYGPDEETYKELSTQLIQYESRIGPEQMAKILEEKQDVCSTRKRMFTSMRRSVANWNG